MNPIAQQEQITRDYLTLCPPDRKCQPAVSVEVPRFTFRRIPETVEWRDGLTGEVKVFSPFDFAGIKKWIAERGGA